jgi:serine/threonine protein kinase
MSTSNSIIPCYGITKDPETNNFMMVMQYANNGSLRQYHNKNFNSIDWKEKLYILHVIAVGLSKIHEKELIHHDFHCGNILNQSIGNSESYSYSYITDLGLCRPANEKFF